jgi:hypothetical protein
MTNPGSPVIGNQRVSGPLATPPHPPLTHTPYATPQQAPVGDMAAHRVEEGDQEVLFPHIYGGIHPRAVTAVLPVVREEEGSGRFVRIEGI